MKIRASLTKYGDSAGRRLSCPAARGFTLIEILLAVGLAGIIAAAALAPLVVAVRSLEEAQNRFGRRHNVRDAMDAIFRDLRLVIANPSFESVKIINKESLDNDADDRLLLWSLAPRGGHGAGLVVYRVLPEDSFSDDEPGLYRWEILDQPSVHSSSGTAFGADSQNAPEPMDIDPDDLEAKDGELILSTARGLRFYFPQENVEDEWEREDYTGGIPKILRVEIMLEEGSYMRTERIVNASE